MSSPSSTTIPVPFVKEAKPGRNDTEETYEIALTGTITI